MIVPANTPEPNFLRGQQPETTLQQAVVAEVRALLERANAKFILIEGFGLDIAAFIEKDTKTLARFFELKAFMGSRGSGVGLSPGPQVNLLAHSQNELQIVDGAVRWLLGMGLLPQGSPRYAIFTSIQAKNAAMNGISFDKTNNLRATDFKNNLITWHQLSQSLHQFLLS